MAQVQAIGSGTAGAAAVAPLARPTARILSFPRLGTGPVPATDPRVAALVSPAVALRWGVLPVAALGHAILVLVTRPRNPTELAAMVGTDVPLIQRRVAWRVIEERVLALAGQTIAEAAARRTPLRFSCRGWSPGAMRVVILPALALMLAIAILAPVAVYAALVMVSCALLMAQTALRLAATVASRRAALPPVATHATPFFSLIVALYHEDDIAPRLVRRLARLDWPTDRVEVLLAVEADDQATRDALDRAQLPPWMRIVTVPDGPPRTKPRALNHALTLARGDIIGIYDAEDTPDPGQLRVIADAFAAADPQVACLQGVLDYVNPRTNWLARCFTLEYAAWFRVILPGIARLGLPVPLGGTTLFFRRAVLDEVGAWDAWNVTEDADLGMRLARLGYRTEVVATVTQEEANCRAIPWVRQRSRWIKGYAMTWAVHMRDPARLWRDLGAWRFWGFQVLFLTSILQVLSMPVLLTLWGALWWAGHPALAVFGGSGMVVLTAFLLVCEGINLAVCMIGLRRSGHRLSAWWVPTLHLYFPLAALAGAKALWELVARPFYWDKTAHGLHDGNP
jgi:glycosyltransferase XagB